jgi:hypothetical protein
MLEPRVVATRLSSSAWTLDLSYDADLLNVEGTVAALPVQNNTPPVSTNGHDDIEMENERTSYSDEAIANEEAQECRTDASISDEFLQLARTLEVLGKECVQELVWLIRSTTFLKHVLTSTAVDCESLRWNFQDLFRGKVGQEIYTAIPSGFCP